MQLNLQLYWESAPTYSGILGRWRFKKIGKTDGSGSSLNQELRSMGRYVGTGDASSLVDTKDEPANTPTILRYLKPENR